MYIHIKINEYSLILNIKNKKMKYIKKINEYYLILKIIYKIDKIASAVRLLPICCIELVLY